MTQGFSFYLNLLRFAAAFVVLLSHFAYERFTRGDYLFIREWNLGSDAVIVFFVISGFVIAYAARERDKSGSAFIFARATRLYSVVLPAILLTLLLDFLGSRLDPAGYDGWWWNPAPIWEVLLRSMSFTTEWSGNAFRPGTNGPFWSLSYEAAYYALFGITAYLSGVRRLLVLALFLLLIGIKPLLLMPAWLLGVWLYRRGPSALSGLSSAMAGFGGSLVVYVFSLALDVPDNLLAVTVAGLGQGNVAALRFSNEFVWNGLLGLLVFAHLAGAMTLFNRVTAPDGLNRIVSWLAGASFSIYLVHYPALQFWQAVLPNDGSALARDGLLLTFTLATCFLFAVLFEVPLRRFRAALLRLRELLQTEAGSPRRALRSLRRISSAPP
ncbi:acyltransferase family protein [Hwanghaeella sp.]|uniref:acyltransferase family protein n=1 Tax=Hwanghaeella sp. TaxID=2605943 RepID=UPI003CCBB6B8